MHCYCTVGAFKTNIMAWVTTGNYQYRLPLIKKKCSKKVCEVLVQVSQTLTSFIPCCPSTLKSNSRAHTIKGISHALSVRLLDVHAESMPYQAVTKNHESIDICYHTDSVIHRLILQDSVNSSPGLPPVSYSIFCASSLPSLTSGNSCVPC